MESEESHPAGDLEGELRVAADAAREAGEILLRHFRDGSETWEKSKGNPVTAADLEADHAIRSRISQAFPEDGILSEEIPDDVARIHQSRCWIIDPMDGTREFTEGRGEFSVSIGLAIESEPVVGVVFNPVVDSFYAARRGGGCFRNDEPVEISPCARLSLAKACASRTEISKGRLDGHRSWFASLEPIGSIAWKLALVAGGEMDVNVSMRPKHEWDVCAGDLLVREAGGRYLDFRGESRRYNQQSPLSEEPMIAASPALLREFLEREAAG